MHHSVMEQILGDGKTVEEMIGYTELGHTLTEELADEMIRPALACWEDIVGFFDIKEYETETRVAYNKHPEAFGTVDALANGDDVTVLVDWKFGRGVPVSATKNSQLLFYAGAARETEEVADMFSPDKEIVVCIVQPAMDEPWTSYRFEHEELDLFVEGVDEVMTALKAGEGGDILVPGSWCKWCPAKPICPEKKTQAQELLETTKEQMQTMFPDELGRLVKMAEEVSDWSKQVMGFAHEELERGHEVTGYKLVKKRATRKWKDEATAESVLRKFGINDLHDVKLISPAQAEKKLKGSALDLSEFVVAQSSGTTMADEGDPRPAVSGKFDSSGLGLPTLETETE